VKTGKRLGDAPASREPHDEGRIPNTTTRRTRPVARALICCQPEAEASGRLQVPMIHPAVRFQLARSVREYARWLAVAEADRSPAPGWWWGPAFAVRDSTEPLPEDWAQTMHLPRGASYGDAARLFMDVMAGQPFQPWPSGFPGREFLPQSAEAPATP
jgi:hypothetical protein